MHTYSRDQLAILRERGLACNIRVTEQLLVRDRRHDTRSNRLAGHGACGIGLIDIQVDGDDGTFENLKHLVFSQGLLHSYLSVCEAATIFCKRLIHRDMSVGVVQIPHMEFFESAMSRKAKQQGFVFECNETKVEGPATSLSLQECEGDGERGESAGH